MRVGARGLASKRKVASRASGAKARGIMTQYYRISLPDGSVREVPAGTTPADVAAAIGPGLAKAALAARVDGELRDLNRPFEGDAALALVTARDEADALELARHDYAHVLAEAVQQLFPGTQITFGPSTDDGFYYDFAPKDRAFTDEDLPAIEEQMRRIIARDEPLVREVWRRADLIARWRAEGESFKADWAAELPEGQAEAIAAAIGKSVAEGAATKADLESHRVALKADLTQVELRLEAKIEQLQGKLLTWFVGTQIAIGGLIIALVKL